MGLYSDRIDLSTADVEALTYGLGSVVAAMARFPENIILQQHACYTMYAMADQSPDVCSQINEETFLQCLAATAKSLDLVRGRCDGGDRPGNYNALYLRKEAMRCIVGICAVRASLGQWLQSQGVHNILTDALRSTADGLWDGQRDTEVEETLCSEILAVCYALAAPVVILESLRRWGLSKPAVARAVADAVVELARRDVSMQALHAAGCGSELLLAMQAHAADEDLQGRIHLAVGFMGNCSVRVA